MNIKNSNIWIIGCSSGIGEALARELAAQGANLALSARSKDKLLALNGELNDKHMALPFDAANFAEMQAATEKLKNNWGRIDSIIFLAATYSPGDVSELRHADVERVVQVNLLSAFYLAELALPKLIEQNSGQFILCASVAGYRGLPTGQPYGATKAALINLAESMRAEVRNKNYDIDIKIINPGFVKTPLTDKNSFEMPMIITPEQAAKHIAEGMRSKKFEIRFPKFFTFMMKVLEILPYSLYFWTVKKITKGL